MLKKNKKIQPLKRRTSDKFRGKLSKVISSDLRVYLTYSTELTVLKTKPRKKESNYKCTAPVLSHVRHLIEATGHVLNSFGCVDFGPEKHNNLSFLLAPSPCN